MIQIQLPLATDDRRSDRHATSSQSGDREDPTGLIFVRHPRAKRYVIRLTADGAVRVTIPRWGSKREALAFAERERSWIAKQRRRLNERRSEQHGIEQHGIEQHGNEQDGNKQPGHARAIAEHATRERAKLELPPRLMALAAIHGLADRVTRISVRNQQWRWGSCSPNGHICLNWRLVTMADDVRDYVLIHELMHLKRMDHSPKFWKLVAQACPDYQKARAVLRAYVNCLA